MAGERILIVEDEGIVAADLESVLSKLKYLVVGTVPTGEEAIVQAEEKLPDLVLMDIRLKGKMDGIDAAEHITAALNIPVTFLTAYADERTLERAKSTMPYGYILKPYRERDLYAVVEMALYKHKMESVMETLGQWHATTLQGIPEAVLATDKNGSITFLNAKAESLSGWTMREVCGKNIDDVLPLTNHSSQRLSFPIEQALEAREATSSDESVSLSIKSGERIPIQYRIAAGKNEAGEVTGAIIVLHDFSHITV